MKKEDAIERAAATLRESVPESTLLVLHDDEKLRKLLAVWRFVPIRVRSGRKRKLPDDPGASAALVDWLWSNFEIDLDEIRSMLGGTFPARSIVQRAKALRLIYPNGTIHDRAEHYLRAATADALEEMSSVRKAREEAARERRSATTGGGASDGS